MTDLRTTTQHTIMNTRYTIQRDNLKNQIGYLIFQQKNCATDHEQFEFIIELYSVIDDNMKFMIQNGKDFAAICLTIYKKSLEFYESILNFERYNNLEHKIKALRIICQVHEKMGHFINAYKNQWRWDKDICKKYTTTIPNFQTLLEEFTHASLDASILES